mgnify:FL=1
MVTAVPEEKSELELKTVWNHAYIDLKPSGTAITSMDEKTDKSCCEICRG